jgi:hypothetical protein
MFETNYRSLLTIRIITHQTVLGLCGGLCIIYKEDLCPRSGDINRLMIVVHTDLKMDTNFIEFIIKVHNIDF